MVIITFVCRFIEACLVLGGGAQERGKSARPSLVASDLAVSEYPRLRWSGAAVNAATLRC